MTCHNCSSLCKKFGKFGPQRIQRYRCNQCKKTFSEEHEKAQGPLGDMRISLDKAEMCLQLLLEGNSVRSIQRITGLHQVTILKLLVLAGKRCARFMDRKMRKVKVNDLQLDEIWTFCRMKEKVKTRKGLTGDHLGDAYCFTAFERDSKLLLTWHLGRRTETDTVAFAEKIYDAVDGTENIIQITTDGFAPYPSALALTLGTRSSYAQLVKIYGAPLDAEDQHRYSPSKIKECIPTPLWGNPNPERICTSHVERQNLNIRTALRRFTRLTIGFSKKWENLRAMLAVYFCYYNFVRIHSSIRCTPAMEAGITKTVWTLRDLLTA
jgi:transposase-like protein/IS1 family transposase